MFRSSSGSLEGNTSPIDNMSSFHSLNMFLDTHNLSPPVSSATLSPPTTPLTPEPATQFPLLTDNHSNMNAAAAATAASNAASTLLLQRQYQYHLLLQQQQQQLALAQHQLALAASAAAANHQQKDEIAHSLKMFALLTACGNPDNASGSTQDAMQEFASNGYVSDDFNRLQYNNNNSSSSSSNSTSSPPSPQLTRCPQFPGMSGGTPGTVPPAAAAASLAAAHWINLNQYREQLNYVWRSMSALPYIPNMVNNTAGLGHLSSGGGGGSQKNLNTLGLAMQPEQQQVRSPSTANIINTNNNNNNNNTNKLAKRYVNGKSGKEMVPRHCVFCENNNEPEALVNSHSVRDSYGRVLCPKLRTYICPICGASGDSAHTIKYCPKKPIVTMEDAIKAESFRLTKSNYYKQQMKV